MMMKTKYSCIALALFFSVAGCGGDDEAPKAPKMPGAPTADAAKTDADTETKEPTAASDDEDVDAYTYDPVGKRDPFKTYFEEVLVVESRGENTTELQKIELERLKLVAVVTGTSSPMAMVEDDTGKGYTVRLDTLIGKRFGRVKAIRRGEIVIREEYRDYTGKVIPEQKSMKLDPDAAAGK